MNRRLKGPATTTYQCPVTGKIWDGNEILIPRYLPRNNKEWDEHWSGEKPVHMGLKICPEVQSKIDEGYFVLVGMDEERSAFLDNGNVDLEGAHRTGEIIYVRKGVVPEILNMEPPEGLEWIFIDKEIVKMLSSMNIENEEVHDGEEKNRG